MPLLRYLGPLGKALALLQLRKWKRRLPNVHRAWVTSDGRGHGIRPETDFEYLARLKQWARDRVSGRNR